MSNQKTFCFLEDRICDRKTGRRTAGNTISIGRSAIDTSLEETQALATSRRDALDLLLEGTLELLVEGPLELLVEGPLELLVEETHRTYYWKDH